MASIAPLTGIKVLDLTKLAPGPHCTMILGDLGADIIKVEEPGPPTGRRAEQAGAAGAVRRPPTGLGPYNALGRNKRSIGLNLKSGPGREVYLRLAQRADVVVEEFRPGVAKRLGIGYETLSARNPRLVYCAVTGFGQTGPYRNYVGHDLNYIAQAGALSMIGRKDQPPTIPQNLLADYAGGGLHAAIGVLAALLARHQTGRGQYVDIAMLDGTMLLIAQAISNHFGKGWIPRRGATTLDGSAPWYNLYLTKDDRYITIGSVEPWFYANLCRALGTEEYLEDQHNREKYEEMKTRFAEIFRTRTRDEWFEILTKADICVGRMLTLDELAHDPQIRARNMVVEVEAPGGEKIKQVGISVKLSDTPGSIRSLAPKPGQHTEEIMIDLGYSERDIERWRAEGAIK
ncbi:MAG TPA: CaiB/BaiF CoA-transferase family protein [Candidatus Binataceae bacterium]|jgi:crotonobetainyl-CoA:carnitine CoA-transferase CaiB-like acyl-CoA transferase|nr:CaiB/BaiF CoA-transferase family protein [Candidatus Binataceae bacterium]